MENKKTLAIFWPILVASLVSVVYLVVRLEKYNWDPVSIAEIGSQYNQGDPDGSEGYDGQFAYYLAVDPNPTSVAEKLDVPSYRYQRILYPLFARTLAFGNLEWIPWTLILVNLFSLAYIAWLLCRYLNAIEIAPRYGLIFSLWAGVIVGVGTDLFEPLAFALAISAWYARLFRQYRLSYLFLVFALLTKEVMIAFWLAAMLGDISEGRFRKNWVSVLAPGVVFFLWQTWLWRTFGSPGITSGGAKATPFELFPFFGFLRIGESSIKALLLFLLIYGPTIILPSIWGTISSIRRLLSGVRNEHVWLLLINCALIVFLPFSTFREPLGLLRVASGMVLATLIFGGHFRVRRALNYGMFWITLLAVLITQ